MENESEDDVQGTNIIQSRSMSLQESLTFGQLFKRLLKLVFGIDLPKNVVLVVHQKVCTGLHIRKCTREECRHINLYYEHFAEYADVLIPAFHREIISNPQLIRKATRMA